MLTLVQGFTPFGSYTANPSQQLVEGLDGRVGAGRLVTAVLPTSYAAVSEAVPALVDEHRPAARLGLDCRVGFLHLPLLPDQVSDAVAQPSMAGDLQARGLDAVLEVVRG